MNYRDLFFKDVDRLKLTKQEIQFQRFIEFPCPWVAIKDNLDDYINTWGVPNNRSILFSEVLIDLDTEYTEDAEEHMYKIVDNIKSRFFYEAFASGGKGFHIHIHFTPEYIKQYINEFELYEVKKALMKIICGKELLEHKTSHVCFQNKTLVQMPSQPHRKGGVKKYLFGNPGVNHIGWDLRQYLSDNYYTKAQKKEFAKNAPKVYGKPPCVHFLEGMKVNGHVYRPNNDGVNRALFFLTAFYKYKKDDEWIEQFLCDYIKKMGRNHTNATPRSIVKSNNGTAGCSSMKQYLDEIGFGEICEGCKSQFGFQKFTL